MHLLSVFNFFFSKSFTKKHQLFGLFLIIATLLFSVFELINLSMIVPLFNFVLNPASVQESRYSREAMTYLALDARQFVIWFGLLIVIIVVFKNLLGLLLNYLSAKFAYSVFKYNSNRIFQKQIYLNKSPEQIESNEIMNDVVSVSQGFAHSVLIPAFHLINEIAIVAIILVLLAFNSPLWFAALFIALGLVVLLTYNLIKKQIRTLQKSINGLYPQIGRTITDGFWGFTDVRLTNSYNFFLDRFNRIIELFSSLLVKNYVHVQISSRLIETIVLTLVVALCLIMSNNGSSQKDLITVFSVLSIVAFRVLPSVNRIMIAVLSINGGYYTLERLKELRIEEVKATPEENGLMAQEVFFKSEIRFEDVSFQYHGKPFVLTALNLSILKGNCVGIIGSSGVGKSTLLKLLLGLNKPSEGKVMVDNTDIGLEESVANGWRKRIGYVQQNVFLRSATIRDNIAFGVFEEDIDNERVNEVVRLSGLEEFINSLSLGVLTPVGEFGSQLSGGQRQRIGIARALYQRPELLVLDEATSALDLNTESQIIQTVQSLKISGLTIVIVTHRYSALKPSNLIYEMGPNGAMNLVNREDLSLV